MQDKKDNKSLTNRAYQYCFAIAFCLLLLGTSIYISCRRDIIFIEYFVPGHVGILNKWIEVHSSNPIVYFAAYCLPDALWYAALLVSQYPLSLNSKLNHSFYIMCVMLPFLLEGGQAIKLIAGTFDIADVITYLLTYLITTVCLKQRFLQLSR